MDDARLESGREDLFELRAIVRDAAPGSTERVRGSADERIAGRFRKRDALRDLGDDHRFRHRFADREHRFLEQVAVFGDAYRAQRRAEQTNVVTIEDAAL